MCVLFLLRFGVENPDWNGEFSVANIGQPNRKSHVVHNGRLVFGGVFLLVLLFILWSVELKRIGTSSGRPFRSHARLASFANWAAGQRPVFCTTPLTSLREMCATAERDVLFWQTANLLSRVPLRYHRFWDFRQKKEHYALLINGTLSRQEPFVSISLRFLSFGLL